MPVAMKICRRALQTIPISISEVPLKAKACGLLNIAMCEL